MSDNRLLAILIVMRVIGGVLIVAMGTYLLLQHHPLAGGFTILGGLLSGGISYSSSKGGDGSGEVK